MPPTNRSRRSFFVEALSTAAGGWVAFTSGGALASLLAACAKKEPAAKRERPQPVDKYGGPPARDRVVEPAPPKYGGPPPRDDLPVAPPKPKYGGPPPNDDRAKVPPAKYGGPPAGPMRVESMGRKYGGPRRTTKYGGPRPKKYGGPQPKKYGGPNRGRDPLLGL